MARERPIILGIDDLQWAEPTFLDLLEYLVGWTTDAPILILGLARPELLGAPADLEHDQLARRRARAALRRRFGAPRRSTRRRRSIRASESGSSPARRVIRCSSSRCSRLRSKGLGQTAIPPTIHALLAARLDRLPAEERAVLERAAVIGREFSRRRGQLSLGRPSRWARRSSDTGPQGPDRAGSLADSRATTASASGTS